MIKGLIVGIGIFVLSMNIQAQEYTSVDETFGAQIGDTIPTFSARDQNDSLFLSSQALDSGAVIVIFYRGEWCPFCNKHLRSIQDSISMIHEKGAQVIAVSPENREHLNGTIEKTGSTFRLLHDENYEICESFDVLFKPTNTEITKYNTFLRADLENAHNAEEILLPVPATFIINKEGVVVWRHFDHDYKKRSTVNEIIKHL